jgi:UDP-N-acetyl-D-mannosaminuronic acid dehydrogenase
VEADADLVVVGGCGRVGLPLSLAFASAGLTVVACDTDQERVTQVTAGVMPFEEDSAGGVLTRVRLDGTLTATTSPGVISAARAVVLVTGTEDTVFTSFLRDGQLVILRSTARLGSFAAFEKLLAGASLTVDLVFCPERLAEGHALDEIRRLPQIIAGRSSREEARAAELFRHLGCPLVYLPPEQAELAKLFTNAWRYISFAAANEFWRIAAEAGMEYDYIRWALALGYPRAGGLPQAQLAGGPCLPKDTRLLGGPLAVAALAVNEGTPVVLADTLARDHDLPRLTVGILGMTFKPGSDDERGSLSHVLRDELVRRGARVLCTDPHVPGLPSLDEVIAAADVLVVATAHPEYARVHPAIRMRP